MTDAPEAASGRVPRVPQIIEDGRFVLFRLPSGLVKISKVQRGSMVELGKFGKFRADDAIGKPLGIPYEIYDRDRLRVVPEEDLFDDYDIEEDGNNNREINDDGNSQALSQKEIEQMKREALQGERDSKEVIRTLMSSNANIDKKTTFSKAKLQKRKEVKYLRIITPVEPTSRAVAEYYFEQKALNTRYMRMDTLAHMLTLGNVGPGWRGIVVDECGGLLLGAVMERMGGEGQIVAIHTGDQVQHSVLNLMNDVQQGVELFNLPWNRFRGPTPSAANGAVAATSEAEAATPVVEAGPIEESDAAVGVEDSTMDTTEDNEETNEDEGLAVEGEFGSISEEPVPTKRPKEDKQLGGSKDEEKKAKKALMKERKERRTARNATIAAALKELHRGGFMSLLCASSYHPTSLMTTLFPYLAGSATFALYSPLKEPLPETYLWLRGSGMPFINVQLTETMFREWQAKKGRMHPEMMTSGTGGFILSGTKVIMNPNPPASFLKKLSDKEENKRKAGRGGGRGGGRDVPSEVADSPARSEGASNADVVEDDVNEP